MKSNQIRVLYDDVFLEEFQISKEYEIEELINLLKNQISDMYTQMKEVHISIIQILIKPIFEINIKKEYLLDEILPILDIKLSDKSLKIVRYLDLLLCLNDFNFGIVDDHIIRNKNVFLVNYSENIANRNYTISKNFLISYFNKKNYLLCYFLGRDLIENIKLYLYFIRGSVKEITKASINGTVTEEIIDYNVKTEIHNKLSSENDSWDFDIKKMIKNNPSLKVWNKELKELEQYNNLCNNYIHKNGYSKISAQKINRKQHIDFFNMWCIIIKFYFTITVCYDGKSIASSDYIDYLEFGEQPPKGSQYWIASIYQDFIDLEYSEEEKNKLKNQSYMEIK